MTQCRRAFIVFSLASATIGGAEDLLKRRRIGLFGFCLSASLAVHAALLALAPAWVQETAPLEVRVLDVVLVYADTPSAPTPGPKSGPPAVKSQIAAPPDDIVSQRPSPKEPFRRSEDKSGIARPSRPPASAAAPPPAEIPGRARPALESPPPPPRVAKNAETPAGPALESPPPPPVAKGAETSGRDAPGRIEAAPQAVIPPTFNAEYLQNPPPRYPLIARRKGEQGTVTLRVLVTRDGSPARVSIERTSGSQHLDTAALETVRTWRFVPARRGGEPIEAWVLVPIIFRLEGAS